MFRISKKLPTDLEILQCIYNEYYSEFSSYKKGTRPAKIYVAVDFDLVGKRLKVDGDIPFGRIYYNLNVKHQVDLGNGKATKLLELSIGDGADRIINAIQFVLLASVLAELKLEHRKYMTNITISWMSLFISIAALIITFLNKGNS
jgi:hypothetical protein